MKDKSKNIKEPYTPENTPNPPQIIDPSRKNEQNENDAPVENKPRNSEKKQNSKANTSSTKPKQGSK
jgi:hypothetical protein